MLSKKKKKRKEKRKEIRGFGKWEISPPRLKVAEY